MDEQTTPPVPPISGTDISPQGDDNPTPEGLCPDEIGHQDNGADASGSPETPQTPPTGEGQPSSATPDPGEAPTPSDAAKDPAAGTSDDKANPPPVMIGGAGLGSGVDQGADAKPPDPHPPSSGSPYQNGPTREPVE